MPFDTAMDQWQAGLRRLAEAPPEQKVVLERVTARIQDELRRRLGGPFRTDELVELYERDGAPVLIWPQPVATARSAIVVSSVSPERCDMTAV